LRAAGRADRSRSRRGPRWHPSDVINESAEPLIRLGGAHAAEDAHVVVARQEWLARCQAVASILESDQMFERFMTLVMPIAWSAQARCRDCDLYDERRAVLSEAYHSCTNGSQRCCQRATWRSEPSELRTIVYEVTLRSDRLLQSTSFDVAGYLPEDNYFTYPAA